MAKMRDLQPRMNAMKERFGDDKQKMSQAMMELYRKEKVNPLGGCLPMLIQMPFFIALYYVLIASVHLRQCTMDFMGSGSFCARSLLYSSRFDDVGDVDAKPSQPYAA